MQKNNQTAFGVRLNIGNAEPEKPRHWTPAFAGVTDNPG